MAMSWTYWRGRQLDAKMKSVVGNAMIDTANAVKAESLQQVPHDEGTLQQTITVMANPIDKTNVKIGYGGGGASGFPVVPYAIKWHETPANFQKGRKSSYLRDPLVTIAPRELKRNLNKAMSRL